MPFRLYIEPCFGKCQPSGLAGGTSSFIHDNIQQKQSSHSKTNVLLSLRTLLFQLKGSNTESAPGGAPRGHESWMHQPAKLGIHE